MPRFAKTSVILLIAMLILLTGCERGMQKPMIAAMTQTPATDDPEAFAMALVQAAVDFHKANGAEATVAYYNDPASIDGTWYVFITDADDIFIAHPTAPSFIGTDLKLLLGFGGEPTGAEIAMATHDGNWTEYLWPNPETDKIEQKRTWSIRYDGYLFSSGYYEPWAPDPATLVLASKDDPETFTRDFVLRAIAHYEFSGVAAMTDYYNDPASMDGQWYVSIADANDIVIASAPSQAFLGTDLKAAIGPDGFMIGAEIAKAMGTGRWVEYLWPNPVTGEVGYKRSWSIRHDGYLFGSGYDIEAPTEGDQ